MNSATHDFHPDNLVLARNLEWVVQASDNRHSDSGSLLRAELDAYYARLYGLTRDQLRYILDPAEVMGADYLSETFRVRKTVSCASSASTAPKGWRWRSGMRWTMRTDKEPIC